MARGGVDLVRFQISWPAIQPDPYGPYDWTDTDRQVAGAAAAGITSVPFIYGTPGWAADCSGVDGAELCRRVLPTRSAAGAAGWSALLRAAVARYGPGGTFWSADSDSHYPAPYMPIRTWQIWNEENFAEFSRPKPSLPLYYRLLQDSHTALTGVDPGAKLMLGGLFRPGRGFLRRLYARKGVKGLFDAVALHPYPLSMKHLEGELRGARRVMDRYGDTKTPIAITELGWGSAPTPKRFFPLGRLLVGPAGQARMLNRTFRLLIAARNEFRLSGIYWYTWQDVPKEHAAGCLLCESAGLFDSEMHPKRSWLAFARLAGGIP
jgi:hypothetical protein